MSDSHLAVLYEITRRWSVRFRPRDLPAEVSVKSLPRPSYLGDNPYNGFSGAERRRTDQVLQVLRRKHLEKPTECDLCGTTSRITFHSEDYFDPFSVVRICFPCHMSLHRRFDSPDKWQARLADCADSPLINDFRALPMQEVDFAGWLRSNTVGPHDVVKLVWPNKVVPDYVSRGRATSKP